MKFLIKKQDGNMVDARYEVIKELKKMKNNIINRLQFLKIVLTNINTITYDNEKTTTTRNIFNS